MNKILTIIVIFLSTSVLSANERDAKLDKLFMELKNAPICKKVIPKRKEDGTLLLDENNNTMNDYSTTNLYDIVIVDEAHEHNTNMDIILTIARYSAYYNNSVKIVIISATMDDDEPRYRRYFRCTNR